MYDLVCVLLVLSLDSRSFAQREAAEVALTKLYPLPGNALIYGRDHCKAEGSRRCQRMLVDKYWDVFYARAGTYPNPRIESGTWYYYRKPVPGWQAYVEYAEQKGFSSEEPKAPSYREATRLWIAQQLLLGVSEKRIRQTLEQLLHAELIRAGVEPDYPRH